MYDEIETAVDENIVSKNLGPDDSVVSIDEFVPDIVLHSNPFTEAALSVPDFNIPLNCQEQTNLLI